MDFNQQKKIKSSKRKIIFAVIIVLLISLSVLIYGYLKRRGAIIEKEREQFLQEVAKKKGDFFINETSNLVQTKKEDISIPIGLISKSENYRLREVIFGGEYGVDISGEAKSTPLKISNVRSETLLSKDGETSTLLISWKTNKLAKSKVIYKKSEAGIEKSLEEDGPGISHALIISKFDPDTRYLYKITAQDRWGNIGNSDEFVAYTSKKQDSVFEMIAGEFKGMFGWVKNPK